MKQTIMSPPFVEKDNKVERSLLLHNEFLLLQARMSNINGRAKKEKLLKNFINDNRIEFSNMQSLSINNYNSNDNSYNSNNSVTNKNDCKYLADIFSELTKDIDENRFEVYKKFYNELMQICSEKTEDYTKFFDNEVMSNRTHMQHLGHFFLSNAAENKCNDILVNAWIEFQNSLLEKESDLSKFNDYDYFSRVLTVSIKNLYSDITGQNILKIHKLITKKIEEKKAQNGGYKLKNHVIYKKKKYLLQMDKYNKKYIMSNKKKFIYQKLEINIQK